MPRQGTITNLGRVDECMARLRRSLIDDERSAVFYDLTTIRSERQGQLDGDVPHFGMSKRGMVARQFMLCVVQTAEGLPICHKVFDSNCAESPKVLPTVRKVLLRYPHIRRLVTAADQGRPSVDNVADLPRITLPGGQPLESILAGRGFATPSSPNG